MVMPGHKPTKPRPAPPGATNPPDSTDKALKLVQALKLAHCDDLGLIEEQLADALLMVVEENKDLSERCDERGAKILDLEKENKMLIDLFDSVERLAEFTDSLDALSEIGYRVNTVRSSLKKKK